MDVLPIVIDNGSGSVKGGFAGDDEPLIIIPTVIGRPKRYIKSRMKCDFFVGKNALEMRALVYIHRPIERGIITNFDDMEKIWHSLFDQLNVDPIQHSLLLT